MLKKTFEIEQAKTIGGELFGVLLFVRHTVDRIKIICNNWFS